MGKDEAHHSVKSLIVVAALATAFSSFTLWLIESWIKYPLFLFEILTIIVLYLIVGGYDIKITMEQTKVRNLNIGLTIDLFLIASALSLLMFNVLQIDGGLVQLALALLCTSLLSGYALLKIFGLTRHFSKLENLVLSYILSYTFTGFITFVSLPINQDVRTLVVLSSFIMVGLTSAFKHRRCEPPSAPRSLSKNIDFLALLVAVTFYVISFCFMYPGFALLPGMDISRHYASSIVLGRTPDVYIGSVYLFSHLHETMFLSLSSSSLVSAQTVLVMLNLMLPLAFYVMAKPYLARIDARLPSLATVFWALFTNGYGGFAWLCFVRLKLSAIGQTQLQLLGTTADKTYYGTIYGISGLWYVPAFVSLVLLMTTIFLMCKKEIPTTKYIALFSIIVAVSYLTHVAAAVIFALFLALYGAISRNQSFRTDDAIKSSIVGFLFVIIIYSILSVLTARFIINVSLLLSLLGPISALLFSLLIRKITKPKPPSFRTKLRTGNKTFLRTLVLSLLFVYAVAFLSWASLADSFPTWQVDTIGLVPWFMYPLMLGINGLLAIIALYHLTQGAKSYELLVLFTAFMIFVFLAGRIVSTINLYFFDAGYWEKRFILFIKLPLAALATLPILSLIDRLKRKNVHLNIKTLASVIIIGAVVLSGVSTSFLNLEYWNVVANDPVRQPSFEEVSAISAFKEMLDSDLRAWLVTVTDTSADMATFAAPADMLVLKRLLYTSYTPEMAFTLLYRHPAYSHPYVYLHNRDVAHLNEYGDRFLAQYLPMLPLVFNNPEVKIYNVSKPSFPQSDSENVLVIPLDKSIGEQNLYMAYHVLSQGFYNYTVAYDLDDKALNARTIILSFDPPQGDILTGFFENEFNQTSLDNFSLTYTTSVSLRSIQDYLDYLHSGGRIILLNTNGYGFFADDLFSISNSTVNAQRIEGQNLKIDLPREISVPFLIPESNSTTTLSHYTTPYHETPFILHKNYGNGELLYCNIFPLIEALYRENNKSAFYEIFGNLLDDLDLSKLDPDVILTFDAYVKEIILTNGVKVETTSLLFPLKLELEQVDVKANNSSYNFHNVTSITLSKYSTAIIETDNAITQGVNGFYTIFQMNSTFSVKPSKDSINLKITANNEEFILNNVSLLSITPNNTIQLLARIPKVSAFEVNFIEFYPQGALQWRTRTYGQNLKVTGFTQFSITLSDSYSALDNVKLGAPSQSDPPIVMFDELSTLPTAMFWSLLLLPLFLGVFFIFNFKESIGNSQTKSRLSQTGKSESQRGVMQRW